MGNKETNRTWAGVIEEDIGERGCLRTKYLFIHFYETCSNEAHSLVWLLEKLIKKQKTLEKGTGR